MTLSERILKLVKKGEDAHPLIEELAKFLKCVVKEEEAYADLASGIDSTKAINRLSKATARQYDALKALVEKMEKENG